MKRGPADVCRAEAIRNRYLGGETLQQIAEGFGISRERVRQVLRAIGVPSRGTLPEHRRKAHDLTEAELLAVDLYRNGTRPKAILKRTGLTYRQLVGAKKRLGVKSMRRGYWLISPDDAEITQQVCGLYLAGKSGPEIVAAIPRVKFPETVYYYLKKGGVKPHGGSRHNHATVQRSATS